MRVENWNAQRFDGEFLSASMDRVRKAAQVIADAARRNCPVGTVSRPMYKRGPYAGQNWTARDAGMLKRSVRVVEKNDWGAQTGLVVAQIRNIRVYAGHYLAWYSAIVEHATPFLRPALNASKNEVRSILENG